MSTLGDHIKFVDITPDGRRALTASGRDAGGAASGKRWEIALWNLDTGERLRHWTGVPEPTRLIITPDGSRAIAREASGMRIWDLECGLVFQDDVQPGAEAVETGARDISTRRKRHFADPRWAKVAAGRLPALPDGEWMAVAPGGGVALCLVKDEGDIEWDDDVDDVTHVNTERTLEAYDVASGQRRVTLKGHRQDVRCVAVTPDGRRAVSGGADHDVRVWDLESGVCLACLQGHRLSVDDVSVTPDGARAVSGSADRTVRAWDLTSGRCLWTLEGHADYVQCVAIAPDGLKAVSGGRDGTLRLWDSSGAPSSRYILAESR